jgi:hypothetical protein
LVTEIVVLAFTIPVGQPWSLPNLLEYTIFPSDRLNEPEEETVDPIGWEEVDLTATRATLSAMMAIPSSTATPTTIDSPTRRLRAGGGPAISGR